MQIGGKFLVLILVIGSTGIRTQASAGAHETPATASRPIVFDTVSVKPNKSNDAHPGSMIRPDGFDAENQTLALVMHWAFGNQNDAFYSGVPGWVSSERFDIIAKVAGADVPVWGQMSDGEKEKMIRDVFADRFKLRTHIETHEQSVYALVVAKGGAKLKPAKSGGDTLLVGGEGGFTIHPTEGWFGSSDTGIVAGNMTLEGFATHLTGMNLGRPVQDRTGVTGRYNFKLDFAPISPTAAASAENGATVPDARPDIFTAIQEQLGLKLESAKGPVEVMVIDHIERPTEN